VSCFVARPEGNPLLGFQMPGGASAGRCWSRGQYAGATASEEVCRERTSATCRTRASGRHVLEPAAAVDDQVLAGDVGGQV